MANSLPTPYTFGSLQNIVQHAIASSPTNNTTVTPASIVNDAIQYLGGLFPWRWREISTTVFGTLNATSIALPSDLEELISVVPNDSRVAKHASPREIAYLQQRAPSGITLLFYYALGWNPTPAFSQAPAIAAAQATLASLQAVVDAIITGGGTPTANQYAQLAADKEAVNLLQTNAPVLLVYPAVTSAAVAAGVALRYRRTLYQCNASGDYPDMPVWLYPLLAQLCRASAVSTQEQQQGEDWRKFSEMLPTYTLRDAQGQSNLGMMRGTLHDRQLLPLNYTITYP